MNRNELVQLRHDIKKAYGLQSRIAEAADVSHTLVGLVLKGERKNDRILLLASQMLSDYKSEQKEKNQLISRSIRQALK